MIDTVTLNAKMQEIVDDAMLAGLGSDAETIVSLALEDWWGNRLIDSIGRDEVERMLDEAAADACPGLTADRVFARLETELQTRMHESADAA